MATFDVTRIKYAGGIYSSVVILDQDNKLLIPPSLYLAELSIRGRSLNTVKNYAYRLNTFFHILEYSSPSIHWTKVTQHNIDTYLAEYLRKILGLDDSSIDGHISAISGFYNHAYEFGFIPEPMAFSYEITEGSKEQNTGNANDLLKKYIEPEKFEELVGFVDVESDFLQERNEIILYLGYHMGLRAAEVVDPRNLRLSKLWNETEQEVSQEITVIGKGEKTRTITILFPMQEKLKHFLQGRRKKIDGDLLICKEDGTALNSAFASGRYSDAAEASGDVDLIRRSFHCLRHSFATNLVISCHEQGFDPWTVVPEQMGHEDYETTFNYVFFEAVLNKRHSILKKLSVTAKDIGRKRTRKGWKR